MKKCKIPRARKILQSLANRHTHTCIYVYIRIYRERETRGGTVREDYVLRVCTVYVWLGVGGACVCASVRACVLVPACVYIKIHNMLIYRLCIEMKEPTEINSSPSLHDQSGSTVLRANVFNV